MSGLITAVYENGILRPLHPIPFREKETVQLQVVPLTPQDDKSEREEIFQLFVEAGLMQTSQLKKTPPPSDPVSAIERQEIADILGQVPGKPLSQIVIEERGIL